MSLATKIVILANGATVQLGAAAGCLSLIKSHLDVPDQEWDAVYYLREVCLGRPVEPEQARVLIYERLIRPDGSVEPTMQAVVLSAVRGEGRVLHVESPFTDPLDRSVAELLNAHNYLGADEIKAIFASDRVALGLDAIREAKKWTAREGDRPTPPDAPEIPSR